MLTVPALTPVEVEIGSELGSQISRTGDRFPIVLKAPIIVEGRELIAAGAVGEGEVVHAKKAGGGGTAGELVLAARFLNVGDRQLRLRSFRIAPVSKDSTGEVNALAAASAATMMPVALLGFAITGGNIVYPKGALATAKTADAFDISAAADTPGTAAAATTQPEGEDTNDDVQETS